MKNIIVLGSTGSIGRQTLDIVRQFPDKLNVVGLSAGNNVDLLKEQINEFSASYYCSIEPDNCPGHAAQYCTLEQMASIEYVDLVMVATTGSVGLQPTLTALKSKKQVALSNKEPIVMAGNIIKEYEAMYGGVILPVDSEPSAIWQCIRGEIGQVKKLIITASGGPFRNTPTNLLNSVTPEEALKHPTWNMGKKITIDSSTMMNKAFEVIESKWLFDIDWDNIEVMIHPQSTVHSMVEFIDGSVKAQLGPPNMSLPIQYALFYPDRIANVNIPRLPTNTSYSLEFEPLDVDRYPCYKIALAWARLGGTYPTVISAADEVAVEAFLNKRIKYTRIPEIINTVISQHSNIDNPTLDDILDSETWATTTARTLVGN
ncbi:MAG: 1-deoxy-D-xylulose-5-phosphate reductoisomerase [Chloroflexota bacterium]|nr:1-deoxy-D-xylulose-5-phosphate reductoisomerase [Chloroflexota bacterium]